jgi:acyl carrier protein
MTPDIESTLTGYIRTQIIKRPDYSLGRDDPLISSGLIDSFHLIDLALFIEDQFHVRIDDTELNASTFDSLAELSALISERKSKLA